MPSSKSTILFLAALAVVGPVAMSQPANALQGMGPPPVRRAGHIQLAHKMTRKRSSPPRNVPLRRQDSPDPPPAAGGATTTPSGSGISIPDPGPTDSPAATSRSTDTTTRTTTQQQPIRPTISVATSSSSSSSAVQTSSSTSTRPTTTAATSTSTTQQASVSSNTSITPSTISQLTANQASSTQSTSLSTQFVTATSVASATPEESDKSKDEGASFLPRPVLVALIVAAACIVAAVALWTIIRKWKFAASRKFEDRLEPINWEPPATSSGLPMDERDPTAVAIARGNSVNSNHQQQRTSFGSSDATHLSGAGRSMTGASSVAPDFPPAHDFTAGAANLPPGAGYADLQRGPSPAPSMNYGGYGQQYSTPNPYETYDYDYNGAYGAYGGVQQPPHNSGPGPHQF